MINTATATPLGRPAPVVPRPRLLNRVAPKARMVLLDVGVPLIAYNVVRNIGFSEYVAMLAATVVSGVKLSYDLIKARRLDPLAGYMMLMFGLSLMVALLTTDARLILAGNTLLAAIAGLICLGSCRIGTPLSQAFAERSNPQLAQQRGVDPARWRRWHRRLSAIWGVGLLIEVTIRLAIIFTNPVDVANGVVSLISTGATGVLALITIAMVRRARRQRGPDAAGATR